MPSGLYHIKRQPIPVRIVIYAKDIMLITGRKKRTAHKLLVQIRKQYNKDRGAFVTIQEFCAYTGLKEEQVLPFLH